MASGSVSEQGCYSVCGEERCRGYPSHQLLFDGFLNENKKLI